MIKECRGPVSGARYLDPIYYPDALKGGEEKIFYGMVSPRGNTYLVTPVNQN